MLRHLEKNSRKLLLFLERKGQRLEIIFWNPVRIGMVEEEPPKKGARLEVGRGMQPLTQSRKTLRRKYLNFSLFWPSNLPLLLRIETQGCQMVRDPGDAIYKDSIRKAEKVWG